MLSSPNSMMPTGKEVSWLFICALKEGKKDELVTLMEEMVASTMKEEGAVDYLWYLNEAETELHVLERYRDATAGLVHSGNFATKFASRIFELCDYKELRVFGNLEGPEGSPEHQLKKALKESGSAMHYPLATGGFSRYI